MSILNGLQMFATLTEQDKKNLELFCQEKVVTKGEYLFKEWEEATAMYMLKAGSFSITKYTSGIDKEIGVVHAEEILGEMAIFWDTEKRMASAQALEDCSLITILNFSIKELTEKNPELLEKIKSIIELRNLQNKGV